MATYLNLKTVDTRKNSKHLYYVYYDGSFLSDPTLFVCSAIKDVYEYISRLYNVPGRNIIYYRCQVSKIY